MPVAPLLRSAAGAWGARVLVIDSAEIAASTAPTFSELLQARLPGLRVLRSGGMASDGSLVMLRGPASFLESSQPLLIVDGVRVDAEQADTLRLIGSVSPSRLDDLAVEDIARVEVLSGAAAAAYGAGAGAGVILVTTKSGAGRLRFSARAQMLASKTQNDFPANYHRLGTSPGTGQPVTNCSLLAVAAQSCNPTGLDVWNPLEQASPFRRAQSAMGHLSLTGKPLGTSLYASLHLEQREGVLPHDEASRLGYRGKIERDLPWRFAVRASHAYRQDYARMGLDGGYAFANDVITRGLAGEAVDDANRGYYDAGAQAIPDSLYPARRLRHTTSMIDVSWNPGHWLQGSLMTGRDRVVDRFRLDDIGPVGATALPSQHGSDENQRLTTTGRVASAYSIREALRGSTALVLDWWKDRIETHDLIDGPTGSFETSAGNYKTRSQSLSIHQGFELPRGVSFNASFQRVSETIFESEQHAEWFPAANVSWQLPPLIGGRSTLRLRAAYAELPGATPSVLTALVPVFPSPAASAEPVRMERIRGMEIGADASLERLATASLNVFRFVSTNLFDYAFTASSSGPPGQALVANAGEIRNSGVEGLFHAVLIEDNTFQWRATLSIAALR
ncbi:MAG TPA: TonB-dependent receptor plug domain-containing protein, partial [Gemmatimonadaceae bacterium]|nr:TonB-dependent receptor plug domain-containing protein [Gemmatimonadaceae bacterium]